MWREMAELFSYHSGSTDRFAEHAVNDVFEGTKRDLKQFGFNDINGKRILDLGCGQRYSFALQCAADGALVTALDINYIRPDFLPLAFYRVMKHNGIKRAVKSTLRRVIWDGRYYKALELISKKPLRSYRSNIDFIAVNPASGEYPLPSCSFDLIASNAVLEHLEDVPKFAREVTRLLVSGGYFYAIIHNFYSLSGGHNLEWAYPDEHPSQNVPPWDHLRENRFPSWAYLNRYLPEQFKGTFAEQLKVISFEGVGISHKMGELEGERFLTPEISAELKPYPKDLLLTRAWRIICKKV